MVSLMNWLTAAGTVATIAAVLVALFQDDLRRWRWTPRIEVKVDVTPFQIPRPSDKKYVPHAFVRLRVAVEAGRASAHNVQVHLISCLPAAHLGGISAVEQSEFLIPLRWSFDHQTSVELPAGGARFLDVLEVRHDSANMATLTTKPAPPEGYWLLPRKDPYDIGVRVVGDNIKPVTFHILVVQTGEWDGSKGGLKGTLEASCSQR